VGVWVTNPVRADSFYKDILGFRLQWKGGRTDTHFDWISMLVPEGHDWVEYMVSETRPTPQQLGTMHHYCLARWMSRRFSRPLSTAGISRRGNRRSAGTAGGCCNCFDKNYTRTEMMIRKPVETPCCSPLKDDI